MSVTCSGLRKDDRPCPCLRFMVKDSEVDTGGPRRCRDCRHTEGCHPAPPTNSSAPRLNLQEMLGKYTLTDRLRRSPPPSMAVARSETNAGLKGLKASSPEAGSSRGKGKQKIGGSTGTNRRGPSKTIKVGKLVLIPCGLEVRVVWLCQPPLLIRSKDGSLPDKTLAPSQKVMEEYIKYGLATDRNGTEALEFSTTWSQHELDDWFRSLLPKAFQWLDENFGDDDEPFHWVLVQKSRNELFIIERTEITGVDVSQAKGSSGRAYTDYQIRLGASNRVLDLQASHSTCEI